MLVNLLYIAVICVLILDISGFNQDAQKLIWKWLWRKEKVKPDFKPFTVKPFLCSLCSSFWGGIIYLLYTRQFTLKGIALTLFIACLTPVIADFCRYIIDLLSKMVQDLYKISKIE